MKITLMLAIFQEKHLLKQFQFKFIIYTPPPHHVSNIINQAFEEYWFVHLSVIIVLNSIMLYVLHTLLLYWKKY